MNFLSELPDKSVMQLNQLARRGASLSLNLPSIIEIQVARLLEVRKQPHQMIFVS